jgi:thymidylate synthase ThyX
MNITAKIIADSVNPDGKRLTSWILKYPRFIHAEFMTHRAFSRNAASSRAIPIKKMIEAIVNEAAHPEFWGKNQKGMQSLERLDQVTESLARMGWLAAREDAIKTVDRLVELGVHKQIVNRLIEPWSHITVLATAGDHRNFFGLRAHPDAQPEFQVLAYRMLDAYLKSKPRLLDWGEWHMPFGDKMLATLSEADRLKIATARAARISYLTFDGVEDHEKDFDIFEKLRSSGHWSPFEHSAKAAFALGNLISNFGPGWLQYRKTFHTESGQYVDLQSIMNSKPNWITLTEEPVDK